MWELAAGTYEEKVEMKACDGCRDCGGRPPKPSDEGQGTRDEPDELSEAEIDDIISDIEDLVEWDNAMETDWSAYSFEIRYLVRIWRNTELECKRRHETLISAYIKAKCQPQ